MSAGSAVAAGRAAAESRMLDTFEIRQPTGFAVVGGVETMTYNVVGTVKGRVKVVGGLSVRESEVGGRTSASVSRELHIPWDAVEIVTGYLAACVAVDESSDPTLFGATLRIDGPAPGSQTTARRLQVSEVLT